MGIVGRQFGRPDGVLGNLVGRFMARNNASLNEWVVDQLAQHAPDARRLLELGAGPGVGTKALLDTFPAAEVVALDPSPAMVRQLRRRNRGAIAAGRLRTQVGTLDVLGLEQQVDAAMAVHVVYFWEDLVAEMSRLRDQLAPGGTLALGYQLVAHMPAVAQRDFPASGHRVLESDAVITDAARAAGLRPEPVSILGAPDSPTGRLAIATRTE